jgi:N-acetylglucosamine-6-sulfatase
LLVVLKTCKARECTHPWEVLHPDSNVRSLKDALSPGFDAFYKAQKELYWTQCEQAYVAESEGPDSVDQFMWHEVAV